jgi:hypothetical protein
MVNHFQNSPNDSTSYQLHLTRQGSTSFATSSGYINDGEQQTSTGGTLGRQLYRADNANLKPGTGPFTSEFWVNILATASGGAVLFNGPNKDPSGSFFFIGIDLTGTVQFNRAVSTGQLTASGVNLNQWHHIVATRDNSGNGYIYIDGELGKSASGTNQTYTTTTQFTIGGPNAWYNNAIVDEHRWIHGFRNSAEVKAEYINQSAPSTFYTISAEQLKP